jgi:hypothetical protein
MALCGQWNNLVTTTEECQVKEGWLGKPKGMLQILWERGWIDSTQVVIGRGVIQKMEKKRLWWGWEIKGRESTICSFLPFESAQGLQRGDVPDLEYLAKELGGCNATISILFTPKYNCELAGEGIKDCWGATKQIFWKLPLKKKKVLAVLQNQCQRVPQQDKHWYVLRIFRQGMRLHAWLSSPSLGNGRGKRRSQEFWAKWENAENLQIPQVCTFLWWCIHLAGNAGMHPYWLTVAIPGCCHVQGVAIVAPQSFVIKKWDIFSVIWVSEDKYIEKYP